MYVVVQSSLCV